MCKSRVFYLIYNTLCQFFSKEFWVYTFLSEFAFLLRSLINLINLLFKFKNYTLRYPLDYTYFLCLKRSLGALFFLFVGTYSIQSQTKDWQLKDEYHQIIPIPNKEKGFTAMDSLVKVGYYTLSLDSISETERIIYIYKGKRYGDFQIEIPKESETIVSNYALYKDSIPALEKKLLAHYEKEGYAFAAIQKQFRNDTLFLDIQKNPKRVIEGFVWKSETKIPKGFQRSMEHEYLGENLSSDKLEEISDYIGQTQFVTSNKNPQVLFLKDSSFVYLYPKKEKKSYFDGIIGFSNNDSEELNLTGNIDLQLGNVFNAFEEIQLHWNSAVNESQDLKIRTHFPYFLGSRIGSETQLHILRQDSTFVNLELSEDLYYHINRRSQVGLNLFLQNSTYLENENTILTTEDDFNKTAWGLTYKYSIFSENPLFRYRFYSELRGNFITQNVESKESENQYLINGKVEYLWKLKPKHYIFSQAHYSNLLSNQYLSNELFRIGGMYSLRGFNENSILANAFLKGTLEYRYVPNELLYFQIFSDAGSFHNEVQHQRNFLLGLGTGITFQTRFGLFSLQYALGKFPNQSFNFDDSRIHIGVKALF